MAIEKLARASRQFLLSTVLMTLLVGVAPNGWGAPFEDFASPQETSAPAASPSVPAADDSVFATPDSSSPNSETQSPATPSEPASSSPAVEDTSTSETVTPSPTEKVDSTPTPSEVAMSASTDSPEESLLGGGLVQPMIAGVPDGGTAPYVYWEVRDTEGNLVPGGTFKFEARTNTGIIFWAWRTGTNADAITDCVGTCSTSTSGNSLERDTDGGEWLLEHRGTNRNNDNRIAAGSNYRVSQVDPPAGYRWVIAGSNTRTIGTANGNSATWNNGNGTQTHDFGTFLVEKLPLKPYCTAGYVYAVSGTGQLQQVSPDGTVLPVGTSASGVSNFNGLGVGSGGQPVYAIERSSSSGTSQNGTVWEYDVMTGTWASTGYSTSALGGNTGTNMIGGAVDLSTGLFYFGGFTSSGDFKVYEYNPSANPRIKLKATVTTTATSNANGDIAFDAAGNFYIVRGSGSSSVVYSVPQATFQAANGGTITSAATQSFSTTTDVNGVAFDSTGKAFLGGSSNVSSYNMPNWSGASSVTSSLQSSTDLASCSSPPTIVIEKEIIGGRVNSNDQFKLTLSQGSTVLGTTTTEGSETGLQDQRIGPIPTVRNVALTFSEEGANGANLANYASAYQCTVTYLDGTVQTLDQVNGTSGSITIPTTGDAVRCVFRNSPLTAYVTVHKDVTDGAGNNPVARQGWTVGATATATTGSVTKVPAANTQTTNNSGNASWELKFSAYTGRATVNVSETMTSGYQFLSGRCVVTHLNGSTSTTTLSGPNATSLTGIEPGDRVDCTYVNKPNPGTLTITKAFDGAIPNGANIEFSGTYTCVLGEETVASGIWERKGSGVATLTPDQGTPAANAIPAGASCSVTEDDLDESDLPNSSWEWGEPTIGAAATVPSQGTANVTVTNRVERIFANFSVTKIIAAGSTADITNVYRGAWECVLDDETVTGTWGPIAAGATWTSTAGDQIPVGAECSVTEETLPDAPVAGDPSHIWGTPDLGGTVVATDVSEDIDEITVTNRTVRHLGSVAWKKVDASGQLLAGSEWTLTGPAGSGSAAVTVTDCTAAPCDGLLDKDPVTGQFKVENLYWGAYTLVEYKAPPGYVKSAEVHDFSINSSQLNYVFSNGFVNNPQTPPVLPFTGGLSRDFYLIFGISLIALTISARGYTQFRKRRAAV